MHVDAVLQPDLRHCQSEAGVAPLGIEGAARVRSSDNGPYDVHMRGGISHHRTHPSLPGSRGLASAPASLINGLLPPPEITLTTVARNGEDGWYYLRDRYLQKPPLSVIQMKQVLACGEASLEAICEPSELEMSMATVYLDLAESADGERSAYLHRSIDLMRNVLQRDHDCLNVARWSFVRVVYRALAIGQGLSDGRTTNEKSVQAMDLNAYYDLMLHFIHFLKIDNISACVTKKFDEALVLATTPEARKVAARAIMEAIKDTSVSE